MTGFEKVQFRGSFRDYQRRVLENADQYLKDGKINIVAALGSGKTVLGLELIRRLGSPCINTLTNNRYSSAVWRTLQRPFS